MDIKRLQKEIADDEGQVLEVYKDHLGFATCGIGHLVLPEDEEFKSDVGTAITQERCDELFEKDIQVTISDCKKIYPEWDNMHEEVKLICANMCFQLGYPRYSKFKKKIQAVKDGDHFEASVQMEQSRWYTQTKNRAMRLIERMKNV